MPAVAELRAAVADLSTLASGDLRGLWRIIDSPTAAVEALTELLPELVATYGTAASAVAADWYDDLRDELEVPGRFSALAAPANTDAVDVMARWSVGPLFATEPDWARALTLIEGGVQRRIANAARDTITTSSIEDPKADGWQRVAHGGCAFCEMLASRGAVFTKRTADFAAHDHCSCVAAPSFRGRPRPVKPYTPSDRTITDADRERVRAYLAEHHAG